MTNQELLTRFGADVFNIALSFAALLGLGAGLRFWWAVLRG